MPEDTTQRDIGRIEGRLEGVEGSLKSIERLLREQNEQASLSRKALYERVGKIETDIQIHAGIETQTRDHVKRLEDRIDQDVMPVVAEYRHLKSVGIGMLALAAIAGGTFIAAVVWVWQHIRWPWAGGP